MKLGLISFTTLLVMVIGCASPQYTVVKTGIDSFVFSGPDINQLRGNAYKACISNGFDTYTVTETEHNSITVRCEKNTPGFFSRASESASQAWEKIKKAVSEYRKE